MKQVHAVAFVFLIAFFALFFVHCEKSEGPEGPEYTPVINPANFVSKVDNQYYPLKDSTTFIYRGIIANDTEDIKVHVTKLTKVIMGVTCVEVTDTVKKKGKLAEAILDWYAQDKDGNVWYFGEATKEFDTNGVVSNTLGSWEAGTAGAQPGILMEAHPAVGDVFIQEYLNTETETEAEVLILNVNATVPAGPFDSCVVLKEATDPEPEIIVHRYFAPGIGCVLENFVKGQAGRIELVEITKE
jgi:hypothetical protein